MNVLLCKFGDEAGKCYLSLMLCWIHRKLNDPVVFFGYDLLVPLNSE